MSRRRFLFWRDLAPSIRHASLMSSTTPPPREARFWVGYLRGSGSPFQLHPRLRRQNAVIPINGLATLNCARSAGSQPIPVIAKGLIVPSFLLSKAANRPYRIISESDRPRFFQRWIGRSANASPARTDAERAASAA